MRCFTPSGSAETSMPPTRAVPDVGASSPHSMRIVVDLPAPLLPRKPKISPRATSNDTSSTATNAPKRRVRWRTSIAGAVDIDLLLPPDGAREARIGEPGARKGGRAIEGGPQPGRPPPAEPRGPPLGRAYARGGFRLPGAAAAAIPEQPGRVHRDVPGIPPLAPAGKDPHVGGREGVA